MLNSLDYKQYKVDLLLFSPKGLYLQLVPKEVKVLNFEHYIRKELKWLFTNLFAKIGLFVSVRNPYKKGHMHNAQINWKWSSKLINCLSNKYDVAIAYSQGKPTYFVAEKVEANKKMCWVNTDYKLAGYNGNFDQKYYNQYDQIIAVSEYNRSVLINEIKQIEQKTSVIYDILSTNLIHSLSQEKGGFQDGFKGVRILTIGRLVDAKGYDLAIGACYKLKQEGYNFRWYAIGEGNQKSKFEEMVYKYGLEENFVFLGTHHNPYTYLKQCDIYVQPSRFEGYGLAIAEARTLHKPIVVTNFPVVYNQIRDRENGLIVSMHSDNIYKAIKEIIDNSELRAYISNNLVKEDVGTEKEIDKFYSLIR